MNVITARDATPSVLYTTRPNELSPDDYEVISVIGEGSYGRVSLVKDRRSNQYFALKQIKKEVAIQKKQVDHVKNELFILNSIGHPFIVWMQGFYQDSRYINIILEYVPGGELFCLLRRKERFGKLQASFYAAQIVLIFEHLHSFKIVYRDLKPENLLIAADGYLKLSDFGLSKVVENRTYTLCGTPEYMSPEVLKNTGHGKGTDWWTLGILIYEMLVGIDPFNANHPMDIYKNIIKCRLEFPEKFYRDAKSLIKHLLEPNLAMRYGNLRRGQLMSITGYQDPSLLRPCELVQHREKEHVGSL